METIMTSLALFVLMSFATASADAKMPSAEADRLNSSAAVLTSLSRAPDKDIPQDLWDRTQCVVVMPSVKKVAFVFGGEYGKGVVTCRSGRQWSAPAFVQLEKGSWGAQIGAEEIDLVLLIMNRSGLDKLLQDKVSLGAGASIAAGPVGRAVTASTDLQLSAEILSYSRSNGVFAGLDLSGGVLGPDNDANYIVYGPRVNARAILLDHTVPTPPEAASFVTAVSSEFNPDLATRRH